MTNDFDRFMRAGIAFAAGIVSGAARAAAILSETGDEDIDTTPKSVVFDRRRILIDGRPQLVLAGEIHYFRLAREDWEHRIGLLKANGLNTVATYMPWIWHELPDGSYDFTGRSHPQRDLVGFLHLCHKHGLAVLARPGPFVMAELKNEGVPFRVYNQHPELLPVTWGNNRVSTRTIDYLAPAFLTEAQRWYDAIMPVLAKKLASNGGPIIGVQLDNEIGMLSWVSNSPDLTDVVCEDMRQWALQHYGDVVASARVGASVTDPVAWAAALRNPSSGASSLALHHDIGVYMRDRFRRYVHALRSSAEQNGVSDVPFYINIHGTSAGRCGTFPIGISQLYETYRDVPQMTSGSDIYLGDLTVANGPGLYVANAFMAAMHDEHQPMTSLEFECGNGDYGEDLSMLYTPEAVELKTRMYLAQGGRLLNYYLHAGGQNPVVPSVGDGIDRLAFTGQRHGFAAPVGPEGKTNPTYDAITRVLSRVAPLANVLADSDEEHDDIALGFVVDHFLTEYKHPQCADRAEQVNDLERFRGGGPREVLARALVLNGFSFPAVDVRAGVPAAKAVALATGRTLGRAEQENLATYVRTGGKLLLLGMLPDRDHDGEPCTILADALGLADAGRLMEVVDPQRRYWPLVAARGALAPRPDVRVGGVQLVKPAGETSFETLLVEVASGTACGARVACGKGEAVFLGCDYPCADLGFYREALGLLGVTPRWSAQSDGPGLVLTSTASRDGTVLLHILNLAPNHVRFSLKYKGETQFGGRTIMVPARGGLILPMRMKLEALSSEGDETIITASTAEFLGIDANKLLMRRTQEQDVVYLETARDVRCDNATVCRDGNSVTVTMRGTSATETIRFR